MEQPSRLWFWKTLNHRQDAGSTSVSLDSVDLDKDLTGSGRSHGLGQLVEILGRVETLVVKRLVEIYFEASQRLHPRPQGFDPSPHFLGCWPATAIAACKQASSGKGTGATPALPKA